MKREEDLRDILRRHEFCKNTNFMIELEKNRQKRKEYHREYTKKYFALEKNRQKWKEYHREYTKKYIAPRKVRIYTMSDVPEGLLRRPIEWN